MITLTKFNRRFSEQIEQNTHQLSMMHTHQLQLTNMGDSLSTPIDNKQSVQLQSKMKDPALLCSESDASSIALDFQSTGSSTDNLSQPTTSPQHMTNGHFNKAFSLENGISMNQNEETSASATSLNENKNSEYTASTITDESSLLSHFTIKWSNLDYIIGSKWYKLSSSRKLILNSMNGCFQSGQLSAILGPSGAGKSTLVDCLVGKKRRGLSGKTEVIFHDGVKRDLKIVIIPQVDHLMDTLTVTESFMFASKLKNSHMKDFDHFKNVQRVLEQLNLTVCSKQYCNKLSGGQYKRVSIGQELLSNPDIMILDEPTSGLDAVTCYNTVTALRDLIKSNPHPMAVIASIHQPDIEVFRLFQHVYVIASGGRPIYEGSVDNIGSTLTKAAEIITNHHDGVRELNLTTSKQSKKTILDNVSTAPSELSTLQQSLDEQSYNPAKLIVEVASHKFGFELVDTMNKIHQQNHQNKTTTNYDHSHDESQKLTFGVQHQLFNNNGKLLTQQQQLSDELIKQPHYDYSSYNPDRQADLDKRLCLDYANSQKDAKFFKHVIYHCHRTWLTILRDPMLCTLQIFLHVAVPLLISYAFYGYQAEACPKVGPLDLVDEAYNGRDTISELQMELRITLENLGYMFFQIYVIVFAAVCVTSLTFPLAVHVLLKEYRNGWYNLSTYFIGRTLADLPMPTFNVILAMAISYHLTGQADSYYNWRFFSVAILVVLATLIAQTQGLMFGAYLMNAVQSAVFVAPASTAPLVVVSGFLLRTNSLPFILQVFGKLSYFTYVLNGFIVSRYGFGRCQCDEELFDLQPDHVLPQNSKAVINIWLDTFKQDYGQNSTALVAGSNANEDSMDLVDKLSKSLEQARTFGFNITSCDQLKPFPMLDYELNDSDLTQCFIALIVMLFAFRVLAFLSLTWMIRISV